MLISAEETQSFKPPVIHGALPDIPDGQANLLPISQLDRPLNITIVEALIDPPIPQGRQVDLHTKVGLRGSVLATAAIQSVTTPIQFPIPSVIPSDYFITEGIYEVRIVLEYIASHSESDPAFFEVDKTAPNFGSPAAPPDLPEEVIRDGLTSDYLEKNQDKVVIGVAPYFGQRPGDAIELYLGRFNEPVSSTQVLDSTSVTPIELKGSVVRNIGNGNWPVFFTLKDRAGNTGPVSRSQSIDVKLT